MSIYDYQNTNTGEGLFRFELEEQFVEWLSEVYDEVTILGVSFSPSDIVLELDPSAFEQGLYDFIDGGIQSGDLIDLEYEDWQDEDEEDSYDEEMEAEA